VNLALPYTRFQLANGLDVIVHEDHRLPLVAVNVWYRVGSGHEVPGPTGFAHLFEHLMFEGSAHVPPGAFDTLLEGVGGANNGSTSTDRTNYWINVPASALELALWLESDRMGFLLETMDQHKLDVQRDVVKNERRQSYENQPYGLAWETVSGNLYPEGHPYHHPVIGSMADLEAASLEDVRRFFRTWYAPGNASLAIAGDVTVERARTLVERWFGEIPAGAPVPPLEPAPVALARPLGVVMEDRVQLARLYLAWHSSVHYTDDDAALTVLGQVLTDGKSSRLHRRLVHDEQSAQDVTAWQNGALRGGTFEIEVTAKPDGELAPLEAAVREELVRVAQGGVEEEEVARAVAQLEAGFVQSLERVGGFGGRADQLNEYAVFTGDPGYALEDLERHRRVTPARVAETARRWLLDAHGVALSVVPEGRRALAASPASGRGPRT
jgi:zinc protease